MPPIVNPRGPGTQWGQRLASMRERVLPPGATLRTRMPFLICVRCLIPGRAWGDVWILEPPGRDLIVKCEQCGGRDHEVNDLHSEEYRAATGKVADWTQMIDRRIERRQANA